MRPSNEHGGKARAPEFGELMDWLGWIPGHLAAARWRTLTITAERREEKKEGGRSSSGMARSPAGCRFLPGADEDDIAASYHDGIRQVRVGIKVEKAEAKHISIAKVQR